MVGQAPGVAVNAVYSNAIAIAVGADQAYLQIVFGCFSDACDGALCGHLGLDERRVGLEW